jgi:hypothetical protein
MDTTGKPSAVKTALPNLACACLGRAILVSSWVLGSSLASAQDIDVLKLSGDDAKETPDLVKQVPQLKTLSRPEILPALSRLEQVAPSDRVLKVSLSQKTAELSLAGEVALRCQISHGCTQHATPCGEYLIDGVKKNHPLPHYGVIKDQDGCVLVRSVFSILEPLPHGCVFEAMPVRYLFHGAEGVPCLIGGQVTGTGATNGCVMIPEKVAALLHDRMTYPFKLVVE